MKNETWIAVIIGALVLVLVVGSIASLRGSARRSLDATDLPSPTPPSADSPKQLGQTSYTNIQHMYSLVIPAGYSLSSDAFDQEMEYAGSLVIQAGDADYTKPALRIQSEVVGLENTYRDTPYTSTGELAQLIVADVMGSQSVHARDVSPLKESIYLGNQTYTFSYVGDGYRGLRADSIGYKGTYTVMITRYRDTYYQIMINDVGALTDILASLQFLTDLSGNRYTNGEFNFSFALEPGEHAVACTRKNAQSESLIVWTATGSPSPTECDALPAVKMTVTRKSPDIHSIDDWVNAAKANEPTGMLDRSPITISGITGMLVKGSSPLPYTKALFERDSIVFVVDEPILNRDFVLSK